MSSLSRGGRAALLTLLLGGVAQAAPLPQRDPPSVQGTSLGSIAVEGVEFARELPAVVEASDSFQLAIVTELKRLGYEVHAADPGLRADYSLSGSWTEARCDEQRGKTCGAVIDWTLHDAQGGKVYRLKTRSEEDALGTTGAERLSEKLLLGGLRSLASRDKFRQALQKPDPASPGTLPEATLRRCRRGALAMPKESDAVMDATAVVRTNRGVGSAVVISPDGYLLTAAHVVERTSEATILFRKGPKLRARVVRYDTEGDVALLQLEPGNTAPCLDLQLLDPNAGQELYVIGAPAGEKLSFSLSRGILSGKRTIDHFDYLQTDASVNPGNSGGPMVDGEGQVLGIVSWKLSGRGIEGLGFAVPSPAALRLLSLSLGDATSDVLSREKAVARVRRSVVDTPDPPWSVVGNAGGRQAAVFGRSQQMSAPLWIPVLGYSLGVTSLITGGTIAGVSAAVYQDGSRADYFEARTWNDVGWITAGVGAALIATAIIVPPLMSRKPEPPTTARWIERVEPRIGPLSVEVKVLYR